MFSTWHSIKENSTDVGLFVAHANSSTTLLLIDGHTGEISWSFDSKTGLAVAPVPVSGLFGTQQAFVIWLPKLEAVTLISKSRKSRDIPQQVNNGNSGDTSESAVPQPRKLLSVTSDLVKKNEPRHRRHEEADSLFSESAFTSPEEIYNHELGDDYDFDNNDDSNNDYSDDIAKKEFQLVLLEDILENFDDSSFALEKKLFNTLEEHDKPVNKRHGARKENLPFINQRGHSEYAIPFTKKHSLPKIIQEKSISGEESFEVGADQHLQTDLEDELSDLTNHKKDENLIANHKARAPLESLSTDPSFLQSSPKVVKEFPPEPTRIENEDVDVKLLLDRSNSDQQFSTEDHKKEDLKLASAKKPSYHKRSVPSSQTGSKCAKSFGDSADAYVAVLLMKARSGRQLITEISEEGPLYLGKGLFCF